MSLEIYDYSAYTTNGKGGNRAAVVFGLSLESKTKMQDLAVSLGAPATVFVGISDRLFAAESPLPLRLRFFTPHCEENICGHGTVAALLALENRGGLNGWTIPTEPFELETPLGIQNAYIENNTAWLEYPDPTAWNVDLEAIEVAQALGLEPEDLHEDLGIFAAGVGRTKLVCAVPSTMLLDAAEPNPGAIRAVCQQANTTGIVLTTFPGRGGCFTDSRHFSLQGSHVLENAATANAHAALAAYLAAHQFFDNGARRFAGAQGYAMRQPSRLEVKCTVQDNRVVQVWIGGKALSADLT
ncbi:MAG: PhzF family phenazine biosynthesis protein [Deinococcales bacterium]